MKGYIILIAICLAQIKGKYAASEEELIFPQDFVIGTATSSYQIEGAWNLSDKGESIWDRYAHSRSERIFRGQNADVACDSYNKYKEDVKIMKDIGFQFYRFSISWPRILPTGYPNVVSRDGIKYYHDLLDELERNNIEPHVTLYHWDHPQVYQEMGGWTNEAMVDWFGDYARIIFQEFGHRVKMFSTINEPNVVCGHGYSFGTHAPGLELTKEAEYRCTTNILKAHARAYHIYNDEFRAQQNGKIGIVISCNQYYSKNQNDTESGELAYQFDWGRYAHPVYSKNGDYPQLMKAKVAENSKLEGLLRSKLPTFSEDWINYIRGSADYFGLNHYTAKLVEPIPKINGNIYANDHGLAYSYNSSWPDTCAPTNKVVPEGLRDVLRKIKTEYGNIPVYITENGLADVDSLEDHGRMRYFHLYMKALLEAVNEYGCNVKAYTVWSLLDNFEWNKGYSEKYGIVQVDFKHPNRTRTLKDSAHWLSRVIRTRKIQPIPKQ